MKTLLVVSAFAVIWSSPAWEQSNLRPVSLGQRQTSSQFTSSENAGSHRNLTGCIRSMNSGYVLEEKSGKKQALGGQDFAAHVGQLVSVSGNNNANTVGKTFIVSQITLVSDRCYLDPAKTEQASTAKPSPYHHK